MFYSSSYDSINKYRSLENMDFILNKISLCQNPSNAWLMSTEAAEQHFCPFMSDIIFSIVLATLEVKLNIFGLNV